jgi:hypothetical protein
MNIANGCIPQHLVIQTLLKHLGGSADDWMEVLVNDKNERSLLTFFLVFVALTGFVSQRPHSIPFEKMLDARARALLIVALALPARSMSERMRVIIGDVMLLTL